MKKRVLALLMGTFLFAAPAFAQQRSVTGKVTNEQGAPLTGVQIGIKGTTGVTLSNSDGK